MIEQDLELAIQILRGYGQEFADNRQRVAELGGRYFSQIGQAAAPVSNVIHKRYSTPKVTNKFRAPKGRGVVTATYYPGNLGASINVMKFRRAKTKVYIGAKLSRGSKGKFSGLRADGYYMHFTEIGTPHQRGTHWFENAWKRSEGRVYRIMTNEFIKISERFKIQHGIK